MEIVLRIILLISRFLLMILFPINWYRSKQSKTIPPIDDEILRTSATKLAQQIRQKQISSEAVITAYIARINTVNPIINAVIEDRFTAAVDDARNVDRMIASDKHPPEFYEQHKPLLGVPVTVKESCSLQGLSLTSGCLSHRGRKALENGRAVQALLEAGAIPLLVSNTPELCLSCDTTNLLHGTTVNPYDTNRSAGGSSGGEGALIGSGASLIGIGSDIGGSIRIPAFMNGIFGHKPTPHIVPNEGHFPVINDTLNDDFLCLGPLARYAPDLRLMLRVLAGDNAKLLKLKEEVNLQKLNVFVKYGIDNTRFTIPSFSEMKEAIQKVEEHLGKLGAKVHPGSFVNLEETIEMAFANFACVTGMPNIMEIPDSKEQYCRFKEILKSTLGSPNFSLDALLYDISKQYSFFIPQSRFPHYLNMRQQIMKLFNEKLGDNGIFLFPSFATPAPYLHQGLLLMGSVMNTMIFNVLCLPATQVPIGFNEKGLPIGIQVIAGPFQDHLCLAVAEELERTFSGWTPPKTTSTKISS